MTYGYRDRTDGFIAGRGRASRLHGHSLDHSLVALLDAFFRRQVEVIEHAGGGHPLPDADRSQERLVRYLHTARGRPVVVLGGSSRDSVLDVPAIAPLREAMQLTGELLYRLGIGCVSGIYWHGWMWESLQAFLAVRERRLEFREQDDVFIGGVPLRLGEVGHLALKAAPNAAQAALMELIDELSPPQAALESRTPLMYLSGVPLLSIYGPDGIGTNSELSRDHEADQHRGFALTWWTGRTDAAMRQAVCLDFRLPNGIWNYDALRLRAHSNLAIGASLPGDWQNITILRIGDATNDGGPLQSLDPCPVRVEWFDSPWALAAWTADRALQVYQALAAA